MKLKKLNVFNTSAGVVLGTKEDQTIAGTLIQAGGVTEDDFAKFRMAELNGELVTMTVGINDTISERDLSRTEKLRAGVVDLQFAEAVDQKETWLISQVFGELRGKN